MFHIQKGRSRNTEVEFLKIDIDVLFYYLETKVPNEKKLVDGLLKETFQFPISSKVSFIFERYLTKAKRIVKKYSIGTNHVAFYNDYDEKDVIWRTRWDLNEKKEQVGGTNSRHFSVGKGRKIKEVKENTLLYIVFDGGFEAKDMHFHPYFLMEHEFEYVYEVIE